MDNHQKASHRPRKETVAAKGVLYYHGRKPKVVRFDSHPCAICLSQNKKSCTSGSRKADRGNTWPQLLRLRDLLGGAASQGGGSEDVTFDLLSALDSDFAVSCFVSTKVAPFILMLLVDVPRLLR
ncbi:hypothetical protein QOT17_012802 [Balamuthia mandrillaris]